MSFLLFIFVVVLSLVLATWFVVRDAKKFAVAPPAPLIDLDRMYDVVFTSMDEETGSKVTPQELKEILHGLTIVLSDNDLIKEEITGDVKNAKTELSSTQIAKKIIEYKPNLDVDFESIEKIVGQSFEYLTEINAIVNEV